MQSSICSGCGSERNRQGQRYCRACHAAYMRGWRPDHPLIKGTPAYRKALARSWTKVYVRRGIIPREVCRVCGEKAEIHHLRYEEPRKIEWLCRRHHLEIHPTRKS